MFVFSSEVTLYVNECDVETGLSNALCALDSTQSDYTFIITRFDVYDPANSIKINFQTNNPLVASGSLTLSDLKVTSYWTETNFIAGN